MKRPGFIAREKVVHREKTIVCYCKGQIYILKRFVKNMYMKQVYAGP